MSTNGRIIESNISSLEVARYKRGGKMMPNVIRFLPKIKYEYSVNSKVFQSSKIYLTEESLISDFISADALIEKYPLNENVLVHYNPDKPETAFLEKKDYQVIVKNLISGLILLFFGFGILISEFNM